MKEAMPYNFRCVNPSDYELTINMKINSRLLNFIFTRAKEKLQKDKGIEVTGNPTGLKSFLVPPEHLRLIKTAMHKTIRSVEREVSKDGIVVMTMKPDGGRFEKNGSNDWSVQIVMRGTYADKR